MKKLIILSTIILSGALNLFSQSEFTPEQKFIRALRIISANYVDTFKMEKSVEVALVAMLEHLDPHSVYMTAEELKKANEPLLGNFEGVGIQFQIIRDTILVVAAIPGGPSEQVGVQAGDKIITIDGEDAFGTKISNDYVMKKLRGDKGTKVKIGIIRYPSVKIMDFEIIRDKIPINSLDAAYMLDKKTGYIKLNRFSNTTLTEFLDALRTLKKQNMTQLVLDLRGNSGGFLKTAIDMADQFFEKEKLLVYTEGIHSRTEKSYSTGTGEFKNGKLIVLVDQGSASASEILAGAIQDWDRGLIVGRRTFGKGLVQKPFNFPDGSAIRLTTARYYTPTGRCIQKPYDDDKKAYQQELNQRLEKGEYVNPETVKFPDSLMHTTPAGRKVYGGGGIMPDVFVPVDTSKLSDYYVDVVRKNIVNQFVSDYLLKNKTNLLSLYPSVNVFKTAFPKQSKVFMPEFYEYAAKLDVAKTELDQKTEEYLTYLLSAYIARGLYDMQAFYQVISEIDIDLKKAMEIMGNDKNFKNLNY